MVSKSNLTKRLCGLYGVILLAAVALLVCVGAVSVDKYSTMTITNPVISYRGAFSPHLNEIRAKRHLRTHMETTIDEDDDSLEDRAFELSISSVTKLKDLAKRGTQKLTASTKKLVETAKLKLTSTNQQAIDKLFTRLKVDKVESNLLESAQFEKWVRSVTKTYKKNPEVAEVAMVSTLTTRYGDEALTKMLVEAEKVSNTKDISKKLEEAQLTNWLVKGQSADDVFTLLKLDKEENKLFESPVMSTWVSYVTKLDKKNSNELMFSDLKTRYDDETLVKLLIAAKEDRMVRTVAGKLENMQLENFLSGGKTADDVYKLLKLDDEGGNLLKNPAFDTWVSYVTKVDKENPYDKVLLKLTTRYDDESLAKVLIAAKEDYKTRTVAEKLKIVQLENWLSGRKTADDVSNFSS